MELVFNQRGLCYKHGAPLELGIAHPTASSRGTSRIRDSVSSSRLPAATSRLRQLFLEADRRSAPLERGFAASQFRHHQFGIRVLGETVGRQEDVRVGTLRTLQAETSGNCGSVAPAPRNLAMMSR